MLSLQGRHHSHGTEIVLIGLADAARAASAKGRSTVLISGLALSATAVGVVIALLLLLLVVV